VGDGRGSARAGLLYAIGAYTIWGIIPLYFRAVEGINAEELLAQRIAWSFILLSIVVTILRRWPNLVRPLRSPRTLLNLSVSALLLAGNWLIYIHSVESHQVIQASLGYFMLPLFSVFLGLIFLSEHLRPAQWLAVGLAVAGIGFLIYMVDEFPGYALGVAVTFGLYGLVRKVTPVDGLTGVTIETLLLTPAAAAFLGWWWLNGTLVFGTKGARLDALVMASGIVTAVPLLCFGQATRRLPLSTLGFLQYIGPTLALFIAVYAFDEQFKWEQKLCFALVWSGLAVLGAETLLKSRRRARLAAVTVPELEADPQHAACGE
jgi:chloramphenicol-sensitive protein RarD